MKIQKEIRIYHLETGTWSLERNFVLYFSKGFEQMKWQFDKCEFDFKNRIYNLDDWEALAEAKNEICRILTELNN